MYSILFKGETRVEKTLIVIFFNIEILKRFKVPSPVETLALTKSFQVKKSSSAKPKSLNYGLVSSE